MPGTGSITVAFADLQWLRRFAAMLARDPDEAEDLVQETLVVAWADPPRDVGRPARPWLATVLRNRFRMQRRADARRELREGLGTSASTTTAEPERELERLEVLRILLAELDRLAPEDQKILVRRFFAGEHAADIAASLNFPAATVRSRIHRSLQRLRDALDRRLGDRRAWSAVVLLPAPSLTTAKPANSLLKQGSTMSITVKVMIVAAVGALGVAGWSQLPERIAPDPVPDKVPTIAVASTPAASTPKMVWEQRRDAIRKVLPAMAAAVPGQREAEAAKREYDDLGVLRRACLDDLGDGKSGAVTLSVTKIGAPDIGTIFDDVEIVETTFEDKAVLECLIQSMYGWVGEAPAEGFERRQTSTFVLGEAKDDLKDQRIFEAIIGAHINEVRYCEKRGQPDAPDVSGQVKAAFAIADDAEGKTRSKTSIVGETDLPREVVDCMLTASQRWIFPATMRGRTREYGFVLPIAGRPPK
jgi:RNA polymerase sigma-70 factor (ECF subfamily)